MIGRVRQATSGPLACFVFIFEGGGFYIHCHSADGEGVPVPSKPLMAQGQNNRRLALRAERYSVTCRVDLVFRMSRASLLARRNTHIYLAFCIFFEEFGQCPSPS